jgi:hypothetical protein
VKDGAQGQQYIKKISFTYNVFVHGNQTSLIAVIADAKLTTENTMPEKMRAA